MADCPAIVILGGLRMGVACAPGDTIADQC